MPKTLRALFYSIFALVTAIAISTPQATAAPQCVSLFQTPTALQKAKGRLQILLHNRRILKEERERARTEIPSNEKIDIRIAAHNRDLPVFARQTLERLRKKIDDTRFDAPAISKFNIHTIHRVSPLLEAAFPDDAGMTRALARAMASLYDKRRFADYTENLAAETFRVMLGSRDTRLTSLAMNGQIDHDTIVRVLYERHVKRGLKVGVIPDNAGLLSKEDFLAIMATGPIIDRGFVGVSDYFNTHHGIYPHLFQFDYVMPILEQGVPPGQLQRYFDFLGTDRGFYFFTEAFDIYGGEIADFSQSRSLRDTYFMNNNFFGYDLLNLKDPSEYESARRVQSNPRPGTWFARDYWRNKPFRGTMPPSSP